MPLQRSFGPAFHWMERPDLSRLRRNRSTLCRRENGSYPFPWCSLVGVPKFLRVPASKLFSHPFECTHWPNTTSLTWPLLLSSLRRCFSSPASPLSPLWWDLHGFRFWGEERSLSFWVFAWRNYFYRCTDRPHKALSPVHSTSFRRRATHELWLDVISLGSVSWILTDAYILQQFLQPVRISTR